MKHALKFSAVLAVCGLVAAGCNREQPANQSGQPPDPNGPRIYVSDETGGNVIVINPDEGTVVERIPVGKRPRGIRVSRDGKQLLIALSGSPIAGPGVDESKLPPPDRAADGIGVVDIAGKK